MALDRDVVMELVGRAVADVGAVFAAGTVVLGQRLGLYRALAEGPATPDELAARTDTTPRYVAEWLAGQAAGGYVQHADGVYSLSEEQAFALTDPDAPFDIPRAFLLATGVLRSEPRITEAFRTGAGVGWHEHHEDVFLGDGAFSRAGCAGQLTTEWLPALDGVVEKLCRGARVADVGCGHGASTVLLADAYPASTVAGSDHHGAAVDVARKRAADAGVADRASFEVASAQAFTGTGYDLVTTVDCLHDMGDPLGAARHIRAALDADGAWMVVEPAAGDTVDENLNPVGRLFYGISTLCCVPAARAQEGGYSLGAQAGPAALRQVATDAGFTRFRRAIGSPLHDVYEIRP
ncbi:class I SAM-dependent methyltransferase [Actinomycetospora flava]|uniref:Class I SAM-dependent methyltransferase n=1 Tax=Actinomycetospora flava TaxID=3129232 RepID=A0ABU8LYE8_9PSEU